MWSVEFFDENAKPCKSKDENIEEGMVEPWKLHEQVAFCSNTGSMRDDPYWNFRKNSLALIELSSINKVSLV